MDKDSPQTHVPDIKDDPALLFDWQDYRDLFEDSDLSDEEQQEFLETLWSIVIHFVDLGFDLNPVQILCEQMENISSPDSEELVDSRSNLENQNSATDRNGSAIRSGE